MVGGHRGGEREKGGGGGAAGFAKISTFLEHAYCCFYMNPQKKTSHTLNITGEAINLLALSLHCFSSSIRPSFQSSSPLSLFPSAWRVWTVRVTARINNRQITARSSVFKHSLKSHQPWREANEERERRRREEEEEEEEEKRGKA